MREGVEVVDEVSRGGGVLDGGVLSGAEEGGGFVLVEEGNVGRRLQCVGIYVRFSIGSLPCRGPRVMGTQGRRCCCCHRERRDQVETRSSTGGKQ